jgi:hypothetical protein
MNLNFNHKDLRMMAGGGKGEKQGKAEKWKSRAGNG